MDEISRTLETDEDVKRYLKKYKDYRLRFEWEYSDSIDPENGIMDVEMFTKDGGHYHADFATPKSIESVFRKNKETGECLGGSYFCMPHNIIFVRRLDEDIIKKTIDDLIENLEVHYYFKNFD